MRRTARHLAQSLGQFVAGTLHPDAVGFHPRLELGHDEVGEHAACGEVIAGTETRRAEVERDPSVDTPMREGQPGERCGDRAGR